MSDLKSDAPEGACGFESHCRYKIKYKNIIQPNLKEFNSLYINSLEEFNIQNIGQRSKKI